MNIRTTIPAHNNKWYMNGGGGYNKCIRISGNWVLPNCVGYAYGRFMEAAGKTSCKLSTHNAELWYGNTADGYKRGSTPKQGAIICWRKGTLKASDGAGHVAFVERVNADGSILISQSGYKAKTAMWTKTLKRPYKLSGYTLQGFIYNPWIGTTTTTTAAATTNKSGLTAPSGTIKKGSRGTQVKNLQKCLNYIMGARLDVDGIAGNKTVAAIKNFQKKYGLKVDGIAGKNTNAKIKALI